MSARPAGGDQHSLQLAQKQPEHKMLAGGCETGTTQSWLLIVGLARPPDTGGSQWGLFSSVSLVSQLPPERPPGSRLRDEC